MNKVLIGVMVILGSIGVFSSLVLFKVNYSQRKIRNNYEQTIRKLSNESEAIVMQKIVYKDVERDEFGCPKDKVSFADDIEYEKCNRIWVQVYLPEWRLNTKILRSLLEKIPHCALNWYPDIACVETNSIYIPEE